MKILFILSKTMEYHEVGLKNAINFAVMDSKLEQLK